MVNFILSGAMYPIPRERGLELIGKLRKELHGLALASPRAKQILSAIISNYWLKLFTQSQMPVTTDQITGEIILFITDHYRVQDQDWPGLEHALSREADVDGSRNKYRGDNGCAYASLLCPHQSTCATAASSGSTLS
jgi:hypothetical protein